MSSIARSVGLDPSQLYGWRRKALGSRPVVPVSKKTNNEVSFARVEAITCPPVEIVMGDVVVRVAGNIERDQLVTTLRAVRKA